MDRLLLVVVLAAAAGALAVVLGRRRPDAPSQPGWQVPAQLDRGDFAGAERPWVVVVFSSSTCDACGSTAAKAAQLDCDEVAVDDVSFQDRRDLHERYGIDAVPLVLVADRSGVVQASFVGEPTATDLWATVAELRDPGSVPPGCDHGTDT